MRQITLLVMVVWLTACGAGEHERRSSAASPPDVASSLPEGILSEIELRTGAQAAAAALGRTLKSQLEMAIQRDGIAGAVEFCQQVAPNLTQAVSAEYGLDVRRISLRNRNPVMGVPRDWEAEVLRDFDARAQQGEDPATLSYSAIVADEYRFMKAIPTGALCLNCHGSELAPEVSERVAVLYPGDKATGYAPGDIRGAFVVTRPVASASGR